MAQLKTLTVGGNTYTVTDPEAVSFQQEQMLSAQQQAVARKNIGVWSGQSILDRLCPAFTQEGRTVICEPVAEGELDVISSLEQKNLFYCDSDREVESNGILFSRKRGDSFATLHGTATQDVSFSFCQGLPLKAGTYTVSLHGANVIDQYLDRIYVHYKKANGENVYINNVTVQNPGVFTLETDALADVQLILAAGTAYSNTEVAVQIERGAAPTGYVPHTAFDGIRLIRCGKNLFYCDDTYTGNISGITYSREKGGSCMALNGTCLQEKDFAFTQDLLLKAGTYTVSLRGGNIVGSDHDRLFIRGTKVNGEPFNINYIRTGQPKTFVLDADATVSVYLVVGTGSTYYNATVRVQIEAGSSVSAYEEHKGDVFVRELTQAGAVHGGTFNWSTGVLTKDTGETYQWEPQQVLALEGTNVLCSSTGDTHVKGRMDANTVWKDLQHRLEALETALVKNI